MFFNFIKRNSRKSRKENGIYFSSLIISIIAFYVILSLGEQDVMMFLKTMESDAVAKLLNLIKILYVCTLFFIFFLVYFANNYQLHLRQHEFGLYLMMGMKRSKLFILILGETLWNGLIALLIGIPIALFLTELINLVTSRLIGMGVIGQEFRISWTGLGFTILGFIFVQLIAMLILSVKISRKEPIELLNDEKEKSQKFLSSKRNFVSVITGLVFFLGVIFLSIAYGLAIFYLYDLSSKIMVLILIVGIAGTFMLFRGLASLIGAWVRQKSKSSTGLFVFTARQLQENVLSHWGALAISSLLMLMAMVNFTYGISTALNNRSIDDKTVDFTFSGSEKEILTMLTSEIEPYVQDYYMMKIGMFNDENAKFSWSGLVESIANEEDSEYKESLLNNLSYKENPYFISVSSYNALLTSINKEPIKLQENEIALYSDEYYSFSHDLLRKVLKSNPTVQIGEKRFKLYSTLYTSNVVADNQITLDYALIVPDDVYEKYIIKFEDSNLWNMELKREFVEEKGLMQAIYEVEKVIDPTKVVYESYLSSMGRKLFYTIAGSYTTFYLGMMFLIIANTVLGLKFLMQQKSTKHRYSTASMLGASVKSLCKSAKIQIWLYFSLVIIVALISSVFAIWSMLKTFPNSINNHNSSTIVIAIILFMVIEVCYILIIQRKSDEQIKKL